MPVRIESRLNHNAAYIGQRLRDLRIRNGESVLELANCVKGVNASELAEIESGRLMVYEPVLRSICKRYEARVEDIVPYYGD